MPFERQGKAFSSDGKGMAKEMKQVTPLGKKSGIKKSPVTKKEPQQKDPMKLLKAVKGPKR